MVDILELTLFMSFCYCVCFFRGPQRIPTAPREPVRTLVAPTSGGHGRRRGGCRGPVRGVTSLAAFYPRY